MVASSDRRRLSFHSEIARRELKLVSRSRPFYSRKFVPFVSRPLVSVLSSNFPIASALPANTIRHAFQGLFGGG